MDPDMESTLQQQLAEKVSDGVNLTHVQACMCVRMCECACELFYVYIRMYMCIILYVCAFWCATCAKYTAVVTAVLLQMCACTYVGCLAAQGDGVGGRKVFPVPEETARPVRKCKAVSQPVLHLTAVLFVHLWFNLPTYDVFNLPTECSTFPLSVQPSPLVCVQVQGRCGH